MTTNVTATLTSTDRPFYGFGPITITSAGVTFDISVFTLDQLNDLLVSVEAGIITITGYTAIQFAALINQAVSGTVSAAALASAILAVTSIVNTYVVSALPTSGPNVAIASNALKVGQTTGNGTGTLVYRIGTSWLRVGDDTAVAV